MLVRMMKVNVNVPVTRSHACSTMTCLPRDEAYRLNDSEAVALIEHQARAYKMDARLCKCGNLEVVVAGRE